MSYSALSKRYAKAIFDLASEGKALEKVEGDLTALKKVVAESDELRAAINNPVFSKTAQEAAFKEIIKKLNVQDVTANFVSVLIANGRINIIDRVVESYEEMLKEKNGEVEAEVTSAVELDKSQIAEIEKILGQYLNKKVHVICKVDEQILGGIIIKIGSKMLDASVAGKLGKIKDQIKSAIASF